jgi:hypothetical protein
MLTAMCLDWLLCCLRGVRADEVCLVCEADRRAGVNRQRHPTVVAKKATRVGPAGDSKQE